MTRLVFWLREQDSPTRGFNPYVDLCPEVGINFSPYLSDTVMVRVAQADSPFTHVQIRDILLLNPHGARNKRIIEVLENRTDSFPTSYIDQLDSVGELSSIRDTMIDSLVLYANDYRDLRNSLLMRAYLDTADQFTEIVEPILIDCDMLESKYQLAELYELRGDTTSAQEQLDSIPLNFELTGTQEEFYDDYIELRDTLKAWSIRSKDLFKLDSASIQFLKGFESESNGISSYVRPLLILNDSLIYIPEIFDLPEESTSMPLQSDVNEPKVDIGQIPNGDKEFTSNEIMTVFPNPSNELVFVKYESPTVIYNGFVSMVNSVGQQVKLIEIPKGKKSGTVRINTSNMPEGQYVVKLEFNERYRFTKTLTLKH